jgi:hypothetical protein
MQRTFGLCENEGGATMTTLCYKCGLPIKNMRDLPEGVLAGHNKCIGIAEKPECPKKEKSDEAK